MRSGFVRYFFYLSWVAVLAGCGSTPMKKTALENSTGEFVARTLELNGSHYRYQVFVPAGVPGSVKRPVILFLHGSGERGSDGVLPTQAGLGPYVRVHADDFPAIVVFPQVPSDQEWQGKNLDVALAALDAATDEFNGDHKRTYLTGLSMGGYGTWELALQEPNRFAALVPICGALKSPPSSMRQLRVTPVADADDPYATLAQKIGSTPVWMFHGAKDDVVLPDDDRKIHAAFQTAGGNLQYTEFPEASHNSWDETYRTPALWTWLFQQGLR